MSKAVRIRRWLFVAFALVLILLQLAFILLVADANDFVVGVILSAVPIPLWIGLALWVDRFEPEPPWLMLAAFLWGASVATFFAGIVNEFGTSIVERQPGESTVELYEGKLVAPVVEEILKGSFLLLIFLVRRKAFSGILDGIVYATLVGAGFAIVEDVFYYAKSASEEGLASTLAMFSFRGVLLGLSHPVFTAFTGAGLGLLAANRNRRVFYLAPLAGLLVAIALHFVNNAFGGWASMFFVLLAIALMALIAVLAARREARLVRRHLAPDVVSPEEARRLHSIRGRIADSISALRQGGLRGLRARDDYVRGLTELAWQRHRAAMQRDDDTRPAEVERMYKDRLQRVEGSV